MEWWPVAGGEAWSWAWRAYPGVWLFVGAIAGAYALVVRAEQARLRRRGEAGFEGWRVACFAGGLALLWASLDWPLGVWAAGYLATANAAQDLLVTLGAAPLMLVGLPPSRDRQRQPLSLLGRARGILGQPIIAAAIFGVALMVTHLPGVVDALRPHALGSAAITTTWLVSAVVLWSPLAGPLAGRHRLPYFGALIFLAVPFVFPRSPAPSSSSPTSRCTRSTRPRRGSSTTSRRCKTSTWRGSCCGSSAASWSSPRWVRCSGAGTWRTAASPRRRASRSPPTRAPSTCSSRCRAAGPRSSSSSPASSRRCR